MGNVKEKIIRRWFEIFVPRKYSLVVVSGISAFIFGVLIFFSISFPRGFTRRYVLAVVAGVIMGHVVSAILNLIDHILTEKNIRLFSNPPDGGNTKNDFLPLGKNNYKMFYSGWFSPLVLPFWSILVVSLLLGIATGIAQRHGFKASPFDDEWWGLTMMLVTVSLSTFIGTVRFLMVAFSLGMPIFQRGIVAVVVSAIYVPVLASFLIVFYLASSIFLGFTLGMFFGVK
jgi:hypothetical protein